MHDISAMIYRFGCTLLAMRVLIGRFRMAPPRALEEFVLEWRQDGGGVGMLHRDIQIAICNGCECEVMRGGSRTKNFNTTNLISHLKFRHSETYKDYQTKLTAKQIAAAITTSRTTNTTVRGNSTRTVPKQKQSHAKLWKWLQLMAKVFIG